LLYFWCNLKQKEHIQIYGISGLGADKRIFDFLELEYQFTALDWIPPQPKETIASYAQRMITFYELDTKPNIAIVGVSFGGMIASEMCTLLKAKKIFAISSATTPKELPRLFAFAGKLNLTRWIPKMFLKPNIHLATFMFTTPKKQVLKAILDDTDLEFLRWGMYAITTWKKTESDAEIVTIHGTKDRIIPKKGAKKYVIKNGGHLMVVDYSSKVSKIINEELQERMQV